MTLEQAIEVSVHGFAAGKSLFYPYAVNRIGRLYHLADFPPRRNARKQEIFAVDLAPSEVVESLRQAGIGWHFLCDAASTGADLKQRKADYKALGYRAMATEWIFFHDLRDIPEFDCEPPVRRVRTAEEWGTIPQDTNQKRKLIEAFRQYSIWDEHGAYGWAESRPHGPYAYTADLHVRESQRGKGFGRALMSRLLRDDRDLGLEANALVASTAGARLYPHLGYQLLGTLQMFCPVHRR
jgi:GNAT superfamily N-acetyltransferase